MHIIRQAAFVALFGFKDTAIKIRRFTPGFKANVVLFSKSPDNFRATKTQWKLFGQTHIIRQAAFVALFGFKVPALKIRHFTSGFKANVVLFSKSPDNFPATKTQW